MIDKLLDGITGLALRLVRLIFKYKAPSALQDRDRLSEIINYLVFGVLTTLVSLLTYFLMSLVLGNASYPQDSPSLVWRANVCQGFSWVCAVLFAFFTNRKWVFRSQSSRRGMLAEFGKFVLARIASFLIIELGVFNLLLLIPVSDGIAKLIVTILVVIFNYFASKFAVFTGKKK